jgi:hypothetical protein
MPFDTTFDTTQSATRRNVGQPSAKKSAYLSRFCNTRQRLETGVSGLWLRRRGIEPVRIPPGCSSTPNAALCFGPFGLALRKRDVEVRVNRLKGSMCLLALSETRFPGTDDRLGPVGDLQLGEDV